jgi:hypothetical protein
VTVQVAERLWRAAAAPAAKKLGRTRFHARNVNSAAKAVDENEAVIGALKRCPPKIRCNIEFFRSLKGAFKAIWFSQRQTAAPPQTDCSPTFSAALGPRIEPWNHAANGELLHLLPDYRNQQELQKTN